MEPSTKKARLDKTTEEEQSTASESSPSTRNQSPNVDTADGAQPESTQEPNTISRNQQRHRIEAFRNRIQPLWAPSRFLNDLLSHSNWSIDDAYKSWKSIRGLQELQDETAYESDENEEDASGVYTADGEETETKQGVHCNDRDETERTKDPAVPSHQELLDDESLPQLPTTLKGLPITYHNQGEHERRQMAELFAALVNKKEGTGSDVHLSKTEAIFFLFMHDWDIQNALTDFRTHIEALDLLEQRFEKTTNLRSPLVKTNTTAHARRNIREQQVERLALLVSITDRPDWYSHEAFLEARNWNLLEAVHDWMTDGIPITKHKFDIKKKGGKKGKFWGFGRRKHPITMNNLPYPDKNDVVPKPSTYQWAPERVVFGVEPVMGPGEDNDDNAAALQHIDIKQDDSEDDEDEEEVDREDVKGEEEDNKDNKSSKGEKKRRRFKSAIINDDGGKIVHIGAVDRTKVVFEYFSEKNLVTNVFMSKKFSWPEREGDEDSDKPRFDFNNPSHVGDLNKWRQQNRSRSTGEKKRGKNQEYTEVEKDFIYNLWKEEFNHQRAVNPGMSDDDLKKNLRISQAKKDEWTARLNEVFEGQEMEGGGLRRARVGNAIMTASHRMRNICDEFGLKFDANKH